MGCGKLSGGVVFDRLLDFAFPPLSSREKPVDLIRLELSWENFCPTRMISGRVSEMEAAMISAAPSTLAFETTIN